MNESLQSHGTDIAQLKTDVATLQSDVETINTTIEENELVIASALTNLDERVTELEANSIKSVTGESYITVTTLNGEVTVAATIGTVSDGDNAIALASDVQAYVDSQWEWGVF